MQCTYKFFVKMLIGISKCCLTTQSKESKQNKYQCSHVEMLSWIGLGFDKTWKNTFYSLDAQGKCSRRIIYLAYFEYFW
jgi:hypothetical protein